jgi:hypothetical protein
LPLHPLTVNQAEQDSRWAEDPDIINIATMRAFDWKAEMAHPIMSKHDILPYMPYYDTETEEQESEKAETMADQEKEQACRSAYRSTRKSNWRGASSPNSSYLEVLNALERRVPVKKTQLKATKHTKHRPRCRSN